MDYEINESLYEYSSQQEILEDSHQILKKIKQLVISFLAENEVDLHPMMKMKLHRIILTKSCSRSLKLMRTCSRFVNFYVTKSMRIVI